MSVSPSLFSSGNEKWSTPAKEFAWLDALFCFTVDSCAEEWSKKCARYFSPAQNGLRQDYEGETVFQNPPYGRKVIDPWCELARDQALHNRAIFVQVLPARVDTKWWQGTVLGFDGAAGKVLKAGVDDRNRVQWIRREGLITGIFLADWRWCFEAPGEDAEQNGAPFPTAVVVHASPDRRPPAMNAKKLKASGIDLWLTEAWPR